MKQYSLITKTEAIKLHDRICKSNVPVAIFVRGRIPRSTKITSILFEKAMYDKRMAKDLIGIYDINCLFDWLQDDLDHAGVN